MTHSSPAPRPGPLAVVMGVSGSGKSTVGPLLARHYGIDYRDADSFHSAANVAKMHAGQALTDEDRRPWLAAIGEWLSAREGTGAVVTCSALKRDYRDQLRAHVAELPFLALDGPESEAARRVGGRTDHFMPASLVADQYRTLQRLQADEIGVSVDFTLSPDEITDRFVRFLDGLSTSAQEQP